MPDTDYIYVLGVDGKPQMPTKRKRHVKRLLNTGKARIACHVPYTIQLLYENTPVLQPVMLAEDPGRTNIGMAILSIKGELLMSAVVETRNREIVRLMITAGDIAGLQELVNVRPDSVLQNVSAQCLRQV